MQPCNLKLHYFGVWRYMVQFVHFSVGKGDGRAENGGWWVDGNAKISQFST